MNRPVLWRLLIMGFALLFGIIFSIPNFYGESPAVQVSSIKSTVKLSAKTAAEITKKLSADNVLYDRTSFEENLSGGTLKIRFSSTEEQLKGKDLSIGKKALGIK